MCLRKQGVLEQRAHPLECEPATSILAVPVPLLHGPQHTYRSMSEASAGSKLCCGIVEPYI